MNFSTAVPMLGVLTLATVLLFAVLRTELRLSDLEAYALLGAYLLFIAWMIAETLGATTVLKAVSGSIGTDPKKRGYRWTVPESLAGTERGIAVHASRLGRG